MQTFTCNIQPIRSHKFTAFGKQLLLQVKFDLHTDSVANAAADCIPELPIIYML